MKRLIAFGLLAALASPAPAQDNPDPVERLVIKDACTDILYTYGQGLDEVDPAKITGVFTEDGVWTADGDLVVEGRAAFRKLWANIAANKRPTVGRHAINNIRWQVVDGDNADGTALVQQHRYNPDQKDQIETLATMMLVEISMHCTHTGEGWRFSRMDLKSVSIAGYRHGGK
jgi:ketosteroid isomerase-like protein